MRQKRSKSIKFVVFEGPEGSGKTVVLKAVAERLRVLDHRVETTENPCKASPVYGLIRRALDVASDTHLSSDELLDLYHCDRAWHLRNVLQPLDNGDRRIVLCDRYTPSTLVYQAWPHHARTLRVLQRSCEFWTPDVYVCLQAHVDTLQRRATGRVGVAEEIFDSRLSIINQLASYAAVMPLVATDVPPLLHAPPSQASRQPQLLQFIADYQSVDEIAAEVVAYLQRELLR